MTNPDPVDELAIGDPRRALRWLAHREFSPLGSRIVELDAAEVIHEQILAKPVSPPECPLNTSRYSPITGHRNGSAIREAACEAWRWIPVFVLDPVRRSACDW